MAVQATGAGAVRSGAIRHPWNESVYVSNTAKGMGVLKVALVHDSFTQWGGAERVAAVLHGMFREAPIYTLAVDRAVLPDELASADFRPSFLQHLPGMPTLGAYQRYLPLLPLAAESLRPRGYDLVISSSSSFAHGADIPGECHIAYIHNTMRFAWDYGEYVAGLRWPTLMKTVAGAGAPLLRAWDRRAGGRPGHLLANSSAVAQRIAMRWRRDAPVIPPPVDLRGITLGPEERSAHFCVVTRLIPYKRVDLAIAAANLGREPLLVIGDGIDLPRLQALAGPTVTFAGRLPEAEKRSAVAEAIALIVPGIEDFGMAPVEANAAGTPVVAVAGGGVLDSQVDGATAVLVHQQTPEAVLAGMRRARELAWRRAAMREHAAGFGVPAFEARLLDALRDALPAAVEFAFA